MDEPPPILIAGGGIGGLALALALAQRGRRSQVLEQRASFAAAGAGIQLGPHGVRALGQLGLAQALSSWVGVPEAIVVHDGRTGGVLATLPLGAWIAARHHAPYWVAHRGDLHGALLSAASAEPGISLRTAFSLALATATERGVKVTSAAGEGVCGSALVGGDGLWSSVLQSLGRVGPQFVGARRTRSVLPGGVAGRLAEPTVGLWLAPDVHVVHYPVRGGADIAIIVIMAEAWHSQLWDVEADAASLLGRLGGFHASLSEVLARVRDWRKWALYRTGALPAWSAGRVTLIGDAAHPMLPYLAQGGALALEDAIVLADCLASHACEARAFANFEALRRRRAERVQRASLRQGRIYHLRPPLSWGRNLILRA